MTEGGTFRLTDPFWLAWRRVVADRGLPHQWRMIEETGRAENFRRAAAQASGGFQGRYFDDSDVYKWIEAASYAAAEAPEGEAARLLEAAVGLVGSAQMEDGYLGTYFQLGGVEGRWRSLAAKHEMYCLGHLMEAACAHFETTKTSTLLGVAERAADHVLETFGPDGRPGSCGHQEVEIGLSRLARTTARPRYRERAAWMIDRRGRRPSVFEAELTDPSARSVTTGYESLLAPDGAYLGDYLQDDRPLAESVEAGGHAVRAMYFYSGAMDATDGDTYDRALLTIWSNLVDRRMYVTGGIGSANHNEGFSRDYDLPNRFAYAETCAAVGLVMWSWRMARRFRSSQYMDVLERALYNAVLSGISLDGDAYFYENPLESIGGVVRKPWFSCACCPPNVARLLLSLERYAIWADGDELTIGIPLSGVWTGTFAGVLVEVRIESDMPWDGGVELSVTLASPAAFALRIRMPGWCETARCYVGATEYAPGEDGYFTVRKTWQTGERVRLDLGLTPTWLRCDLRVPENVGRSALSYGPLIYCLEEADLSAAPSTFEAETSTPASVLSGPGPRLKHSLVAEGRRLLPRPGPLYPSRLDEAWSPQSATFAPYFSWANRTDGAMQVWVRAMGG